MLRYTSCSKETNGLFCFRAVAREDFCVRAIVYSFIPPKQPIETGDPPEVHPWIGPASFSVRVRTEGRISSRWTTDRAREQAFRSRRPGQLHSPPTKSGYHPFRWQSVSWFRDGTCRSAHRARRIRPG